jgi:hypothetical protein
MHKNFKNIFLLYLCKLGVFPIDTPQFYMIKLAPQIGNKSIHFQFENKRLNALVCLGHIRPEY